MLNNPTQWRHRWYYIMQNKASGMMYVGQSARANMDEYCGSGVKWVPHCRKHGGYNRTNIEVIEQRWFDREGDAKLWLRMLEQDCPDYWHNANWANRTFESTTDNPFHDPDVRLRGQTAGGKAAAVVNKQNGASVFNPTIRMKGAMAGAKKAALASVESNRLNKKSFFDPKIQSIGGKAAAALNRKNGKGLHDPAIRALRYSCDVCNLISNAAGVSRHQSASNHSGKTKVD